MHLIRVSLCSVLLLAGPSLAGDPAVIKNPAQPARGAVTLPLAELWRLGGDSDADEEFFGVINDVAVAQNGDVYLLDAQLHEVRVFDADGQYRRAFGREGEGPGEFRRPRNLLLLRDGTVGVVQPRPATVVLFTQEGEPAGTLPLPDPEAGGFMFVDQVEARGDALVVSGANMTFGDGKRFRTSRLVSLAPDGSLAATFLEQTTEFSMARIVLREGDSVRGWTLGPDGRVTRFDGFDYRLTVHARDGSVDHVIEREFAPLTRSDGERAAAEQRLSSRFRFRGRGGDVQRELEVSDRDPAIVWFQRRDDGSLWVLSGRAARDAGEAEIGRFDVFDPQGRFVQQVTLLGEGDAEDDRLVMVGDRLFVVTQFRSAVAAMFGQAEEEEEVNDADLIPMEVICYAIDWGEGAGR